MLNQLRDEIHQNAVEHGWWEEERSFGDIIALCHSELSEALEEYRNGMPMKYNKCKELLQEDDPKDRICEPIDCDQCCEGCPDFIDKPEGIAIELANCIIRILDYCGKAGIDIEEALRIKHEYNKTRPYRHGGRKL